MGFNTITTFQNKKYSDGGQWDFLGIDNTRKIPSNLPDIVTLKNLSNTDRIPYARLFQPTNWAIQNKNAAPNTNFQYILGRNFQRKEKDFIGLIFSVTYQKTMTRNDGTRTFFAPEYDNAPQRVYTEDNHNTQTLFGAIGNLSCKKIGRAHV